VYPRVCRPPPHHGTCRGRDGWAKFRRRVGLEIYAAHRQAFDVPGRQAWSLGSRPPPSAVRPSAAFPAGREAAIRATMGPRDKAGRLSHGCAHRRWTRAASDSNWARLDHKYPSAIAALSNLNARTAYLDGELCGVDEDGLPSFAHTQAATDGESGARLVYYAFDLLHLDGRDVSRLPLIERKTLLEPLIVGKPGLQFNGHDTGDGGLILEHAAKLGFEGVVSKTIDSPYAPGNRGLWRKAKALNRQEFVVVGWSEPEGSRPHLGALLLGYYSEDGKLIYAGRVGTGMADKVLADLRRRLEPLERRPVGLNRIGD
jgi:hypothetical protein